MKGDGLRPLRLAVGEWKPGRGIATDPLHALTTAWPAIVGLEVANHSAPLEIAGKTLVIATKSSAWSQQLSFLADPILQGVRTLGIAASIERLAFRSGALRLRSGNAAHVSPAPRRARRSHVPAAAAGPAIDLQDAFERMRDRMRSARRTAADTCAACGAAIDPAPGERCCAPCVGRAATERAVALERIVYMAPWLTLAELREQLPELSGSEFEHARRRLLQRWWLLLERARRTGRISSSGVERHVGSSYVLLQSRLPPDRITPAVVRNLLGNELDALLWPQAPPNAAVGHVTAFVE